MFGQVRDCYNKEYELVIQQVEPFVVNGFTHDGVKVRINDEIMTCQACKINHEENRPNCTNCFVINKVSPREACELTATYESVTNQTGAAWDYLIQFLAKHNSKSIGSAITVANWMETTYVINAANQLIEQSWYETVS